MNKTKKAMCLFSIVLLFVLCAMGQLSIAAAKSRVILARNPGAINEHNQADGFDSRERLTKIVAGSASKIINRASLKCAEGDLVASLLLKNHIGSLIPEDMPKCHDDPDFLAGVCARPSIKNKTILNMVSGLRGTYRRGVPWYWGGIILGVDTLAVETTALAVMNEKRALKKVAPRPVPKYVKIAEKKFNLGTTDAAKIEQIKNDL